jgi:tetratricopeptide (TPR) repeat protein
MWFLATLHLFLAFQSNFYEQGMKAMQEQRYQAAVDDFNNAIAAEPKDFTLHFNLALAYSLLGKDSDGVAEYKKCLDMNPGLYQANLNIGILLLRDKQPADAIPFLTAAVAAKPKEFRPSYYLGEAFLGAGEFDRAEPPFRVALEADPKSAAAESGLGRTLAKQDHVAEAAPHFRKAAELDPKYRDSLLELAELLEAHNQPDEAIELYRQFPDNPAAQEHIGALQIKEGKAEEAVASLEKAVTESPTTANRAALATAYIRNKQIDKAFALIEKLVQAEPNDFELRMQYGRMLRDQRKFPDASQQFFLSTKLKPDSADAWSELAGVLVVAGDYPSALGALDKLAAMHAEKPGHVFLRAIVLDKNKQLKPALAAYQRFLGMSQGQFPNEEFQARQRSRIIQLELNKR